MERVRYDDSRWPIVQVTTPAHVMDAIEFDAHLNSLSRYHERGQLFGFILDVRLSPPLSAEQRRLVAERMERDVDLHGRRCPCAVVVGSALQRGVIKVILWLIREPHPVAVFTSIADAEKWLRDTWALRPKLFASATVS